ncbi:hypothetical protein ONS95_011312 [Cadophora gregata]|uniref:uncharacterized protein n=1 Tax=Cadophora gregata TaxID=51156 RepID=UPI0026DCBC1F|nr:uncharacterized protein ONS95_011312 [Cadophora gregata]KAK0119882.1 hypothetical protein ONS95_011312 [Cadophora gregata]KAK0120918.1 hypothetical protein ONS96_011115 [Cadophora gregata f. sp. sojae]
MSSDTGSEPEPLEPPRTLSTNDLTYGVELEFVFAFHEDLIAFPSNAEYKIVKNLPYGTRALSRFSRVNPIFSPNKIYNSWGVESNVLDPFTKERLSPWRKEPLQIVANILKQNIPAFANASASRDLNILDTLDTDNKKKLNWDNKKQWKITKDHSVCGVGSENIKKWLPEKTVQHAKWDSLGVELVSPILNSNTAHDKIRISEIVNALTRKEATQTGAFITNQCGLHIHVQGPSAAEFQHDLNMNEDDAEWHKAKVWRYLALILLVYEEEIARLHPPCRRPGHPNTEYQFSSNRLGFMKEDLGNIFPNRLVGPAVKTTIDDCIGVDCSTTAMRKKASIPQIREGLSKYSDMDVVALLNWPQTPRTGGREKINRHLGDKDRQVNLTYLMRTPDLPQTVEFRQAKGSLNAEDINHWVDFCIGIVRLAYLYAADPEKFRVKNWEDIKLPGGGWERNQIDVFDLMRDMKLSDEVITYWEERVARWMAYTKGDENDRLDDEVRPQGFVNLEVGGFE